MMIGMTIVKNCINLDSLLNIVLSIGICLSFIGPYRDTLRMRLTILKILTNLIKSKDLLKKTVDKTMSKIMTKASIRFHISSKKTGNVLTITLRMIENIINPKKLKFIAFPAELLSGGKTNANIIDSMIMIPTSSSKIQCITIEERHILSSKNFFRDSQHYQS